MFLVRSKAMKNKNTKGSNLLKKGKVAICAIANKLCNVAFSMLKFNKEFDMDEFKGIYQKEFQTHS